MKEALPSKIKAEALVLFARRRTKVRREARFVRSIKRNISDNLILWDCFRGFCKYLPCTNPLDFYCFMRSSLFLHPRYYANSIV